MTLFLKILFKNSYLFLKNKNYRQFLWLALLHGDKKRYKAGNMRFLKYKFRVPDSLSFIWQFKEIFVDEYYYFNSSTTSPLIVDCGANIGTSCLYFKSIYPNARIKAFEADPAIASILKDNLAQNNIMDVEVINKAVWIHNEGIELSPEGSDAASIYGKGKKIKVASQRLKEVLATESPDMLKIDIEGAETDVIRDCREVLGNARNLFIEFHSFYNSPQALQEILAIMTENNFRYNILSPSNQTRPLLNHLRKKDNGMDLQLNIFGYKE